MFDLNPENLVSPSRLAILTRELILLILDGSTEHDAHVWAEKGNLICLRNMLTATLMRNLTFQFFFYTGATGSDLPSSK